MLRCIVPFLLALALAFEHGAAAASEGPAFATASEVACVNAIEAHRHGHPHRAEIAAAASDKAAAPACNGTHCGPVILAGNSADDGRDLVSALLWYGHAATDTAADLPTDPDPPRLV